MKININHQDIASGCRFNPDLCPVAQALCRAGIDHFGVFGVVFLSAANPRHPSLLPLPTAVAEWIARFDAGDCVRPITFELEWCRNGEVLNTMEREFRSSRSTGEICPC